MQLPYVDSETCNAAAGADCDHAQQRKACLCSFCTYLLTPCNVRMVLVMLAVRAAVMLKLQEGDSQSSHFSLPDFSNMRNCGDPHWVIVFPRSSKFVKSASSSRTADFSRSIGYCTPCCAVASTAGRWHTWTDLANGSDFLYGFLIPLVLYADDLNLMVMQLANRVIRHANQ